VTIWGQIQNTIQPYSTGITILLGGFILSLPSLLNYFPFIFYDSGYYILHGTMHAPAQTFLWRPLTYSIFLGFFLNFVSLLGFIVIQNIIVAWILYVFSKEFLPQLKDRFFLTGIGAMYLTPFPLFSNFLLPDIFSGLLIFAIASLFLTHPMYKRIFSSLGIIFFSIFHHSNLFFASITTFLFSFIHSISKKMKWALRLSLILPWILLASLHWSVTSQFTISNATHAIIFSRLMTLSVAQEFLNEHCKEKKYKLCEHRESEFHIWDWSKDSQIGKLGGIHALHDDFQKINKDIFLSQYGFIFFKEESKNIWAQLIRFGAPLQPTITSDLTATELKMYSKLEWENYTHQNLTSSFLKTWWPFLGWIYYLTTLTSFILFGYFIITKKANEKLIFIFKVFLIAYLFNGIICGGLTDPTPRYSDRLLWVITWIALMQLYLIKPGEFFVFLRTFFKKRISSFLSLFCSIS